MKQNNHGVSKPPVSPEELLRLYIEDAAESVKADYLEDWQDSFSALQSGDERRAELLLAGYLLTISDGYKRVEYRVAWDAHPNPDWGTIMGNAIEINGYSANFLFRVCEGNECRHLAVTLDVDGSRHRSSEAIARDRGIMDFGFGVINFTDQDVLERAADIADEVSTSLSSLMDGLLAAQGHIRGSRPTNVTPIGKK